ncbi:metallothiol transferase FosB [Numidum massiliense]|uniref:metallothiol transferase FosB n=1 Tax=Numidum massiliense TaxID=1522315 RepID=UPI0006D577CD|nr:metallothiol transferase FosB [Numidum massiliense]
MQPIKSINHLTFSVSNLERSITFYKAVFGAKLLVKGERMAYFDLGGLWLALNVQEDIPRREIHESYTHVAFTVEEEDIDRLREKLEALNVPMFGRVRDEAREGKSLYFTDPDGHKFEFHTGNLQQRIECYKGEGKNYTFFIER